ncbi:MAG TPA: hypothetical protein VFZ66_24365 [Herpetosiphonaceae bacterium]
MSSEDERRALVELLPQFLMRRRRGWTGLQALVDQSRLTRPALFLLRALVEEADPGVRLSLDELRARLFNPYSTVHDWVDLLPELVSGGYVSQTGDGYAVTPQGRALIEQMERGAQAYLATLTPIDEPDLTRLADTLSEIAARLWSVPEPAASPHQERVHRLPLSSGSAMARLDRAVYALWTARDDAHNAAWRGAGFDGPMLDLLTRLWTGEAMTIAALTERVPGQRPADIERGVIALSAAGYITRDGDALALTPRGQQTRDAIEAETDRLYFAPWPSLTPDDVAWLRKTLKLVIERLPG